MLRSFCVVFSCCVVLAAGYKTACGPNQEQRCVQSCPPEPTCRNRGIKFSCLQVAEPCKNKCVCKEGYFRNARGDCITGAECDVCQRPNEYFACDVACDNVCSKLQHQNKTNCLIQSFVCNKMCYCDDGYARDKDGNCIPIEKCPPSCPYETEEYSECKKSCPPDTCQSLVARFKCDSKETCKKGCVCKPGYLRKKEGTPCIPICECDEMKYSPDCQ